MSTRITQCPNCSSQEITDLNPELKKTSSRPIVIITAICDECSHEFTYPSSTDSGRRSGILY